MNTIINKMTRLLEASRKGLPLVGEWKKEEMRSGWAHFSERLRTKIGLSGAMNLRDKEIAIEVFDKIEELPVFQEAMIQGVEKDQLREMITLGESMLESLHDRGDPTAYQLARRLVALRYRLSQSEMGLVREDEASLPVEILRLASEWKAQQEHFDNQVLTGDDHRLLRKLAAYREFIPLLEQNEELRETFFNWVIRDHLDPSIMIEFPAIQKDIEETKIQLRLGHYGGRDLKLKRGEVTEVTLPIEGVEQNILDRGKKITLRGNYTLTIEEMFEIFINKKYRVGNLEYMADGINNWNVFKLGYWDNDFAEHRVFDLEQPRWWEQMPHFQTLSVRQAASRYDRELTGKEWVVAFHSTRETLDLNFDKTHAFLQIAIPDGRGSYSIYDIGKYGTEYPETFFDGLSVFCDVMPGAVAFPDENAYYTQRQHAYYPIVIDEEKGQQLMETIRRDIGLAREGNFVYQIESENCAKWAVETVQGVTDEEGLEKLFRIHLLDSEPDGPVAKILDVVKWLPLQIRDWVLTRAHYLLGAWKGKYIEVEGEKKWVSVSVFEFFETAHIYLPSLMIQKVLEGAAFVKAAARESLHSVWLELNKLLNIWEMTRDPGVKTYKLSRWLAATLALSEWLRSTRWSTRSAQ